MRLAPLVLLVALVACSPAEAGDEPAPDTAPPSTTAPRGPVALVDIEVEAGSGGNERVTLRFDQPLPDPAAVRHEVQDFPEIQVCGDTHWFPADDGGSLDVFLPVNGMDLASFERPVVMDGAAEKIVFCEARQGELQVSFWGMGSSIDAPMTDVTVADDGRSLVVENH
jgi:hypothetical protein